MMQLRDLFSSSINRDRDRTTQIDVYNWHSWWSLSPHWWCRREIISLHIISNCIISIETIGWIHSLHIIFNWDNIDVTSMINVIDTVVSIEMMQLRECLSSSHIQLRQYRCDIYDWCSCVDRDNIPQLYCISE